MFAFFKFLHVIAVIAFLGNITVGVFWKAYADSTKDLKIMAYTMAGIMRADRIFTIPGVILVVIGGVGAAISGSYPMLHTGWILWGIGLFVISGIAFGPLARAQRALLAAAEHSDAKGYEAASAGWNLYGTIALLTPFLAAAIMIVKPALPALP